MHVGNLLHPIGARIREQPVTVSAGGFRRPRAAADLTDRPGEIRQFGVAGLRREVIKVHVGALGDDQHMDRCPRGDVVEGKAVLGLKHLAAGDFAPEDPGENVGVVVAVGHALHPRCGPGHCRVSFPDRPGLPSAPSAPPIVRGGIHGNRQDRNPLTDWPPGIQHGNEGGSAANLLPLSSRN